MRVCWFASQCCGSPCPYGRVAHLSLAHGHGVDALKEFFEGECFLGPADGGLAVFADEYDVAIGGAEAEAACDFPVDGPWLSGREEDSFDMSFAKHGLVFFEFRVQCCRWLGNNKQAVFSLVILECLRGQVSRGESPKQNDERILIHGGMNHRCCGAQGFPGKEERS